MDFLRQYLLTFLIFLPAAGALAIVWVSPRAARWTALGVTLGAFVASLVMPLLFDRYTDTTYAYAQDGGSVQLVQRVNCVESMHIQYLVGIDGLNLPLVVLTTFLCVPACIAAWKIDRRVKLFFLVFLLLESCILGVFLALDFVLLFVFLQLSLLLVFMLIALWGGSLRGRAAAKFLLCSLVASIALLIAMIQTHQHSLNSFFGGSFDLIKLAGIGNSSGPWARGTFVLVMFAFLMWLPAVPLHSWLGDVNVQAPAAVNMLVCGLIQNVGAYGILRIAYPLFPDAAKAMWLVGAVLGVASILYAGLCAMSQSDFNRLLAYGSISQSGFIMLGVAIGTSMSVNGAIFIMVARGISFAALLFIAGGLTARARHSELSRFGGLSATMPIYTGLSFVAVLAATGLPGLCGFVGQIMVLLAMFAGNHASSPATRAMAVLVCFSTVLTAAYFLRAVQRLFFGPSRPEHRDISDITGREIAVLTPLTVAMFLLGILPWLLFFTFTNRSVTSLIQLSGH